MSLQSARENGWLLLVRGGTGAAVTPIAANGLPSTKATEHSQTLDKLEG